jgi:hypothetical protein
MAIGYTPYSQQNQDFSDKGHLCAQTSIYPLIFPNSQLQFVPLPEEQTRTLDADMGTDRHVLVKVHSLREAFSVLVQERFRKPRYADFQDITITEWNHNSNLPAELYKIKAEMFLYAYYDDANDKFLEAIAISMLALKVKIAQGLINHDPAPNWRTNQTFLGFKFRDLEAQHISIFRKKWERQVHTDVSLEDGIKQVPKSYNPRVPSLTVTQVRNAWENIVKRTRQKTGLGLAYYLRLGRVLAIDDNIEYPSVVIQMQRQGYSFVEAHRKVIEWALEMEFGVPCGVRLMPPEGA